jgi:SAM-dependent methyltransferase
VAALRLGRRAEGERRLIEDGPTTWHHGLVARWWFEFNRGGDDVAAFQRAIETGGEPALDLACGTGRLLVPFRRAGLDVDGCDVSEDMLAWCAEYARAEGVEVTLHRQAMSQLELPRRYRTILICESFGVGSTRAGDLEALRRIRRHLEPGGTLVFDIELPNFDEAGWGSWEPEHRPRLPAPFPERGWRRTCADGSELELKQRVVDFDPLALTVTRELRIEHRIDGELAAAEERPITLCIYFAPEVATMLRAAGFREIHMTGGLGPESARPWEHGRVFFHATA